MPSDKKIITPRYKHDPLFDEKKTRDYFLSIQAGEHGFAYAILDGERNQYVGIGELNIREARELPVPEQGLPADQFFHQVFVAFPWLKKPFKACKIIWEGEKYTLIPENLFAESAAREVLTFNTAVDASEKVFTDPLPSFKARNIYAIPQAFDDSLKKYFHSTRLVHHTSVLVEGIQQGYKTMLNHPRVFLNVRYGHFDMVVMDQYNLKFLNSFVFRCPEDLGYFTLFSLDQLGIRADRAHVVLMGDIRKNTPLSQLIHTYLRQVEFAGRNPMFHYSPALNAFSPHTLFPLLTLNGCGL